MTSTRPESPAIAPDTSSVAQPAGSSAAPRRRRAQPIGRWAVFGTYLLIVVVVFLLRRETFSEWATWQGILQQSAIPVIVVVGLTITLIGGDFDLSIGAVLGFGMALSIVFMAEVGISWPLACLLALAICAVIGVVNGVLVTRLRVNSFIGTLAMTSVVAGIDAKVTGQETISTGVPVEFADVGIQAIFGMSVAFWLAVIASIVLYVVVSHTEWGRFLYATGENSTAARLAGVRVRAIRTWGFVAAAAAAGAGGILLASQNASYYPGAGGGYLLPAYAAAFLGTAVGAGRFGVLASVFGVIFLQTLQTGLTVLNVEPWIVLVVQGLVLVVAVMVSAFGASARRST